MSITLNQKPIDLNSNYPITSKEKAQILFVWDGYQPHDSLLRQLHYLHAVAPSNYFNEGMGWLIKNKVIGKKFMEWFQNDCQGSSLEMIRQLYRRIENEKKVRKLYAGKDIL